MGLFIFQSFTECRPMEHYNIILNNSKFKRAILNKLKQDQYSVLILFFHLWTTFLELHFIFNFIHLWFIFSNQIIFLVFLFPLSLVFFYQPIILSNFFNPWFLIIWAIIVGTAVNEAFIWTIAFKRKICIRDYLYI